MRKKERGFCERGISGGELEQGISTGTRCYSNNNSFPTSMSNSHIGGLRLCEKELKRDWRVSSSNQFGEEILEVGPSGSRDQGDFSKGKSQKKLSEVEQLHIRLQNFEQETEVMKNELFGSLDERKKLLNEISQKFHNILRNRITGEEPLEGALILHPKGGTMRDDGLSQVLHQELNPFLVTRDLKANIFTFQDLLKLCSNAQMGDHGLQRYYLV